MKSRVFTINNINDLHFAYSVIPAFENLVKDSINTKPYQETDLLRESLISLKKEVRRYTHEKRDRLYNERIIQESIDGYIDLIPLPLSVKSFEDAENYFINYIELSQIKNSQYDCTGQRFTRWHKVSYRIGLYWIYHAVGIDC